MMEITLGGFKTAKGLATIKICIANSQTFYLENLQKFCKVPLLNETILHFSKSNIRLIILIIKNVN